MSLQSEIGVSMLGFAGIELLCSGSASKFPARISQKSDRDAVFPRRSDEAMHNNYDALCGAKRRSSGATW